MTKRTKVVLVVLTVLVIVTLFVLFAPPLVKSRLTRWFDPVWEVR